MTSDINFYHCEFIHSDFIYLESGDPFDPLSAPPAEGPSPDHAADQTDEEEEGNEDGGEEGDVQPEAIDEATSGFLDKVNSGSINSAQFMPAIVDLPEKVKKKRQRKSKDTISSPSSAKKKRKRETNDSSDDGTSDDDAEYRPSATKQRRRQKSAITKRASGRGGTNKTPRRANARRESLFECRYCDFKTETIGTGSSSLDHKHPWDLFSVSDPYSFDTDPDPAI